MFSFGSVFVPYILQCGLTQRVTIKQIMISIELEWVEWDLM